MNNYGIMPQTARIFAIGDLHGDYTTFMILLTKAGIVDKNGNWIGKNTILVQIGDVLDSKVRVMDGKDDGGEIKIFKKLFDLHNQSHNHGGKVVFIVGNHEMMNLTGDLSYASDKGNSEFGGPSGRKKFFSPGSQFCSELSKFAYGIAKIGNTLFVHGSVLPSIAKKYPIPVINELLHRFLRGEKELMFNKDFKTIFLDNNGICWARTYSLEKPRCQALYDVLKTYNSNQMVVGHSVQEEGINSKCQNKIWRIDTGMSKSFGKDNNGKIQALIIEPNGQIFKILHIK